MKVLNLVKENINEKDQNFRFINYLKRNKFTTKRV